MEPNCTRASGDCGAAFCVSEVPSTSADSTLEGPSRSEGFRGDPQPSFGPSRSVSTFDVELERMTSELSGR